MDSTDKKIIGLKIQLQISCVVVGNKAVSDKMTVKNEKERFLMFHCLFVCLKSSCMFYFSVINHEPNVCLFIVISTFRRQHNRKVQLRVYVL